MAAHLEPAYGGRSDTLALPVTERLTATSIILPLFHEMTTAQHDHVVEMLSAVLASRS